VPGVVAEGQNTFALAKVSKSFLLAAVSVTFDVVSARFDAVSCWRTVVSLAAARARLSSAVPKRFMVAAWAGSAEFAPPNGSTPPRSLWQLAQAFEVGKMEGNLPSSPRAVVGR
jgi:hypothetical protein